MNHEWFDNSRRGGHDFHASSCFTRRLRRPEDRLTLMKMLQYVEGMSLDAMRKGIRWDFESFGEYLDALDRAACG